MENESWTPLKLLDWTTKYFDKNNVEQPRLDAELLLAHVLGIERIMLYTGFDRVLDDEQLSRFRAFVRERAAGCPAKYILKRCEFYSLSLAVDSRVLIPRPETELLVERALAILAARETAEFPLVVEIGVGSGAISIALAASFPNAAYVATDVSTQALEVARANAAAHSLDARIEFIAGDLFDPLATMGLEGRVDLIVSNPPYISEEEFKALPREIRNYEPACALVAGPEGTEVHIRILDSAASFLAPGGVLLMEIDPAQRARLEAEVGERPQYSKPLFHRDFARLDRVIEVSRDS